MSYEPEGDIGSMFGKKVLNLVAEELVFVGRGHLWWTAREDTPQRVVVTIRVLEEPRRFIVDNAGEGDDSLRAVVRA